MRSKKFSLVAIALGAFLALSMAVPAAHADNQNQMTKLTFSVPFHIPGNRVLPAGTYWFKTMDSAGPRNVVQIFNADRSQVYATLLTRPTLRFDYIEKTELRMAKNPNGTATLVDWFYPDRETGHAFIYSPRTERRIREEKLTNVTAEATTAG